MSARVTRGMFGIRMHHIEPIGRILYRERSFTLQMMQPKMTCWRSQVNENAMTESQSLIEKKDPSNSVSLPSKSRL